MSSMLVAPCILSSRGPLHLMTGVETKGGTKVIMTTPPFLARRESTSSGTLRGWSVTARALEWEKITGASDRSSTCRITAGETCEMSTSMPRRFISRTTSRPKGVRPSCRGVSVAESAQSVLRPCVRVR